MDGEAERSGTQTDLMAVMQLGRTASGRGDQLQQAARFSNILPPAIATLECRWKQLSDELLVGSPC